MTEEQKELIEQRISEMLSGVAGQSEYALCLDPYCQTEMFCAIAAHRAACKLSCLVKGVSNV